VKLLLFDVDQTLIFTGGAGLRALDRACLTILSVKNATQGILPHGKTDPAIIREILLTRYRNSSEIDARVASILESYVFFLKEEVRTSEKYRVLPGIAEILAEISARADTVLGLATGNVELGARIKLDRGDLNRYFAFGGFGSDSENRTTLVRKAAEAAAIKSGDAVLPEDTFVIGDTPLDIEAGRGAGFKTVGVATGHYSVDELLAAGATFAIPDFEQGRESFLNNVFLPA
jgi:phosphoglycolate phosphatase